jgi:hypothetical protein
VSHATTRRHPQHTIRMAPPDDYPPAPFDVRPLSLSGVVVVTSCTKEADP